MVALVEAAPSLAVSRKTYVPLAENVAVVSTKLALPNVTVPGPLTFVHVVVGVAFGNPSSVTVPSRLAMFVGNVMVWSGPAFAVGAVLAMITTSSLPDNWLSLAVSRNVYVPPTEKLAVVPAALVLPKVTVPGPLTLLQV